MAYYLDSASYDSNAGLAYSHSTSGQPSSHLDGHLSYAAHDGPMYTTHHSHLSGLATSNASPRTFPAFDPDSPFNSPFVPVRSVGRDGRLKNKLMGVGTEGGYLTSPLIMGKSRMGGSTSNESQRPEIAINSPVPSSSFHGHDQGPLTNLTPRTSSLPGANALNPSSSSNSMTGMGIGITGLSSELELGDYGNPATNLIATARPRSRMSSYQTTTIAEDDATEVAELIAASSPSKNPSPIKFPNSPPTAGPNQPPATGRRPKKNLTLKTLNKAKSCSALSPTAQAQQYGGEPLTPVSSHSNNFMIPGVPFNSPLDEALAQSADPGIMPFSFADLYSYGLAVDSVDEIDVRKSPYQFANDLLLADGSIGIGIGLGSGLRNDGVFQDDQDYQASLPTPSFAHGSGFSSPSVSSRSGPSPNLSSYASPGQLTSATMLQAPSMLSAPSMESAYSLPLPTAMNVQGSAGRQRCATYNAASSRNEALDPALVSPHQHRQASSSAAYGPQTKFSYPSRYQAQGQAPAMTWANSVPPSQSQTPHLGHQSGSYLNSMDTTMFIPPFHDHNGRGQVESLDEMYERLSGASTGYSTPGKRGRGDLSEDEGEYEDDYTPRADRQVPLAQSGPASPSPHKRLRTVASAPCLPTRRMRPGPKPKSTKSPQEQHQSVFSAHLSPPPIPQLARFARSETDGTEDDEDDEGLVGGINGPNGALPKELIQSLYESVPAHVDETGAKVSKRYLCLMDGCDRTFPRKSAIESHIQTHLEDKPFVCPYDDCDASFVRQHDLRRHERIHSGNKPFPCPCGKGFARGDALARHRARGICEGSLVPRRV